METLNIHRKRILLVIFLTLGVLRPASGNTSEFVGSFSNYEVQSVFSEKTRFPDFQGSQKEFRVYRTKIREKMENGPNFSGNFSIIQVGCGSSCSVIFIANHFNGDVFELKVEKTEMYSIFLDFKINSRLLVVRGQDRVTGECAAAAFELKDNILGTLRREVFSDFRYCEGDVSEVLGYFQQTNSHPAAAIEDCRIYYPGDGDPDGFVINLEATPPMLMYEGNEYKLTCEGNVCVGEDGSEHVLGEEIVGVSLMSGKTKLISECALGKE